MTDAVQRWRGGRDSYRPAGEPIDVARYGVEPLTRNDARAFVERHHYEHSFPAWRFSAGLYRGAELVGAAVFAEPGQHAVMAAYVEGHRDGAVLSRFVLLDDVEANGETWFLARAFRLLRRAANTAEVDAVVSYSDPVARSTSDGRIVKPGHVGTIYQAFNGAHVARSKRERVWLAPDGTTLNRRSMSKLKRGEVGAGYAEEQLRAAGAPPRTAGESGDGYLARVLALPTFRSFIHPGNHVYVWPLDRRATLTRARLPYPKAA